MEDPDNVLARQATIYDSILDMAGAATPPVKTYTVALIAHDNMKNLMRKFVKMHVDKLKKFELTGTGTTCKILRSEGLEPAGQFASGPLGGDQQVGAMIVEGQLQAVLFFRDPLTSHAHAEDIGALGRLCDCYQCYFATNFRSASACLEMMHGSLHRQKSIALPDGINDLVTHVQSAYLATRAAAVAKSGEPEPSAAAMDLAV